MLHSSDTSSQLGNVEEEGKQQFLTFTDGAILKKFMIREMYQNTIMESEKKRENYFR